MILSLGKVFLTCCSVGFCGWLTPLLFDSYFRLLQINLIYGGLQDRLMQPFRCELYKEQSLKGLYSFGSYITLPCRP